MATSLKLHIPEPCHENWQNMTQQEQGRFCGSCQKTVVDFSIMTDQEVLNYFNTASHNVCGRFSNDQLNKELTVTEKKKRFSLAYIWNVILATLLITEANAQVKPKPKKPVTINTWEGREMGKVAFIPGKREDAIIPVETKGKVVDAQNNQPISGASISIKGASGGTMTDTAGNFRLKVEKKDSLVLVFSAIGYEPQTRVIDDLTNWQDIQVYMKPVFSDLSAVSVIGYGTTTCRMTMGEISSIRSVTATEKITRVIDNLTKKDVQLYPNPVVRGNNIQVKLSLPQAGSYKLELLNTSGQVMLIQPLLMHTKEQQIDLYTQAGWSAGIYWVRISSPDTKNVHHGKLLLQ